MMQRGSGFCALVGRWGLALSLVIGAVLLGRIFRDMPYLLPNRLPGIVLYEMGPGLLLAVAIGCAVALTRGHCRELTRVVLAPIGRAGHPNSSLCEPIRARTSASSVLRYIRTRSGLTWQSR